MMLPLSPHYRHGTMKKHPRLSAQGTHTEYCGCGDDGVGARDVLLGFAPALAQDDEDTTRLSPVTVCDVDDGDVEKDSGRAGGKSSSSCPQASPRLQ